MNNNNNNNNNNNKTLDALIEAVHNTALAVHGGKLNSATVIPAIAAAVITCEIDLVDVAVEISRILAIAEQRRLRKAAVS